MSNFLGVIFAAGVLATGSYFYFQTGEDSGCGGCCPGDTKGEYSHSVSSEATVPASVTLSDCSQSSCSESMSQGVMATEKMKCGTEQLNDSSCTDKVDSCEPPLGQPE